MMEKITKDTVLDICGQNPRREFFNADYSGLQKDKPKPSFSVRLESTKKIFEIETGLSLRESEQYNNNYWRYVDESDIEIIEQWEKKREGLVFLRNCLFLSIALELNYSETANLIFREGIKQSQNQTSINSLAQKVSQKIQSLPYYKDSDLICAVPSHPSKEFDLPGSVTSLVSIGIGKQDITNNFIFGQQKKVAIKNAPLDEKWKVWEDAEVAFNGNSVKDKTIILIDDIYQSGITIQYIAMKLQEAGAKEIYGLCFVKTFRDKDNAK